MAKTSIEWADVVWNPVTGCTKVSQGCKHCYAERIAGRFWKDRKFTDVRVHPERLEEPLKWRKPRRVFVNSMSDLFHEKVSLWFIARVFAYMATAKQHTFMVLTKRPLIMQQLLSNNGWVDEVLHIAGGAVESLPLPNVWLGVSVEDQQTADERIPYLLQTPAAVRFVSCEPLLGPVDLEKVPLPDEYFKWSGITGVMQPLSEKGTEPDDYIYHTRKAMKLDWVIAGGESGPGARPMHPDWARSLRDQCQEAGVPFFFKQWGEWTHIYPQGRSLANIGETYQDGQCFYRVGKSRAGNLLDGAEWRQFPEVK